MAFKVWLVLAILILSNMTAFMYVLAMDVVSIPAEPMGGIKKLGVDVGTLLVRSQSTISDSIQSIKENPDMGYYDRVSSNNRIMGATAFTFFWVFIFMAIGKFLYRKEQVSFRSWLKIIFVALILVGILQVMASWLITGEVIWPYQGVIDLVFNLGEVANSFMVTAPVDIAGV